MDKFELSMMLDVSLIKRNDVEAKKDLARFIKEFDQEKIYTSTFEAKRTWLGRP